MTSVYVAAFLVGFSLICLVERSLSVSAPLPALQSCFTQVCPMQGSVLGPLLFTVFVSPIGRLIENCNISYHAYADDTQLFTALTSSVGNNINRLVSCVESLQSWFWHNGLLLNPDKSEIIFLGTRQRLQ